MVRLPISVACWRASSIFIFILFMSALCQVKTEIKLNNKGNSYSEILPMGLKFGMKKSKVESKLPCVLNEFYEGDIIGYKGRDSTSSAVYTISFNDNADTGLIFLTIRYYDEKEFYRAIKMLKSKVKMIKTEFNGFIADNGYAGKGFELRGITNKCNITVYCTPMIDEYGNDRGPRTITWRIKSLSADKSKYPDWIIEQNNMFMEKYNAALKSK